MRKMKYVIGFLLFFMIIGFATVTVSLSISGNARILSDVDDFKVYFSDVKVNDVQDLTLVKSETELAFDIALEEIGSTYKISYDVTNASKVFDASLSVTCTESNNHLSIVNEFDDSNLPALTTRTGDLTLTKIKSNASETDTNYTITCTIVASPVERDSEASGEVISPLQPIQISTGDVISIAGENFNVISQTEDTVTMLSQQNISDSAPYKQTSTQVWTIFADANGWEYTPGPKEIDVQTWGGDVKTILNNYVSYLNTEYGVSVTGDLITVSELGELGCTVPSDYAWGSGGWTCTGSEHSNWLVNGQEWWTRSADSGYSDGVWYVDYEGSLGFGDYGDNNGVRPVITIPIELARKYKLKNYEIGEEVTIDTETFNVISDNGTTVTMLAQYNLGTDYKQTTEENYVTFSDTNGWEYTPGPKEIDIQVWSTNPKTYVNEYVSYLQGETGDTSLGGNLITLQELGELGCTVPTDYAWVSGGWTCTGSEYSNWLINGQYWRTRSASSVYSDCIWMMFSDGDLGDRYYGDTFGVRPVITISKTVL